MEKITKDNVDYNKIYVLTQEDACKTPLHGIRIINYGHVNEIFVDIINGNATFMAPLAVNINNMAVVDGAHRYRAICKAWEAGYDFPMKVIFYDIPLETESDIVVKINTTQKSWTAKDYKHKLLAEDNCSIQRLDDFCMSHSLLHGPMKKNGTCKTKDRYGMAFLRGENLTKSVKDGTINITKEDVEFANKIYPEVEAIYNTLGYTGTAGWFEYLIQGWYAFRDGSKTAKRFDKFGFDKYMEKMKEGFDTEQVLSKQIWQDRFTGVLTSLETDSKRLG